MKGIVIVIVFLYCVLPFSTVFAQSETESSDRQNLLNVIAQQWPGVFGRFRDSSTRIRLMAPVTPKTTQGALERRQFDPREGVRPSNGTFSTGGGQHRDARSIVLSALSEYEQRNEQFGQFVSKLRSRRSKMEEDGYDMSEVNDVIESIAVKHRSMTQFIDTERVRYRSMQQQDASVLRAKEERSRMVSYMRRLRVMHDEATKVVGMMRTRIRTASRVTVAPDQMKKRNPTAGTNGTDDGQRIMQFTNPGNAETWPQDRLDNAVGQ